MNRRSYKAKFAVSLSSCLALAFLLSPQASVAQSDSRLFLSPSLRVELERRRLGMVAPEPVVQRPVDIEAILPDEPVEDVIIKFGGAVFSDNSVNRVWLNGRLLDQAELPAIMTLVRSRNDAATLRVQSESSGRGFELKAGQVLNLTAGELYESYEWARIERAAAEAAAAADPC